MPRIARGHNRGRIVEILMNYKVQLEQNSYQRCDFGVSKKPNTRSLKKDERDMRARDNLRRKRLKEEREYEAV